MPKTDVIVLNNVGGGVSVRVHKLPAIGESVMGFDAHLAKDVAKGGNVAMAIARLGVKVAIIGKIGKDEPGDRDIRWLKEDGVDVSALLQSNEVATGQGYCFIDDDGNNMIITGESSSKALTLQEVRNSIEVLSPAKIFVGGFEIRKSLVLEACKIAKSKNMVTILNPSPVPSDLLEPIEYIDYLIVNQLEARLLSESEKNLSLDVQCKKILDRYHAKCVIVTLGDKGVVGMQADQTWMIPGCHVDNVIDTCGAGDGFLAAIAANLVWGKNIVEACRWANVYSAYTVTKAECGFSYPTLDELNHFVKQYNFTLDHNS